MEFQRKIYQFKKKIEIKQKKQTIVWQQQNLQH
jgi:hypothetical protein